MSWTYSGDPSASNLDAVRFEIGDTDIDDQLLQNSEIEFTLANESSTLNAAARCCEVLQRKFARQVDKQIGPLKVSYSQRADAFKNLAKDLRMRASQKQAPILTGPLDENTSDIIFTKGMMDNEV